MWTWTAPTFLQKFSFAIQLEYLRIQWIFFFKVKSGLAIQHLKLGFDQEQMDSNFLMLHVNSHTTAFHFCWSPTYFVLMGFFAL